MELKIFHPKRSNTANDAGLNRWKSRSKSVEAANGFTRLSTAV
jgi:hypothetical protein